MLVGSLLTLSLTFGTISTRSGPNSDRWHGMPQDAIIKAQFELSLEKRLERKACVPAHCASLHREPLLIRAERVATVP